MDSKRRGSCYEIFEIPPQKIVSVKGTVICGKRGGQEFYKVTRPDPTTLKCPNGTVPCSKLTSPDNTVCYPPAEIAT